MSCTILHFFLSKSGKSTSMNLAPRQSSGYLVKHCQGRTSLVMVKIRFGIAKVLGHDEDVAKTHLPQPRLTTTLVLPEARRRKLRTATSMTWRRRW